MRRTFEAIPDKFISGAGVFTDSLVMTVAGQDRPAQVSQYALDRKTRTCVQSNENWAYSPLIVLNGRVGYYGPLFPGGLSVGDSLQAFFNDPNKAFDMKVAEKLSNYNGLGITALKVDATRANSPYYEPIAKALLESMGLPMQLSFSQVSAQLKARGLDLEGLVAGLARVASPEDVQALMGMTQKPIKLTYTQESGDIIYIEQKTGATVGADFDRTTLMEVDTSALLGAFAIMAKYAQDPTVGPAIQAAMQAATQMSQAGPTKVFNQRMTIIKSSQQSLAKQAKDKGAVLGWATVWIPLIVIVVGFVVAAAGAFPLFRTRKTPEA